MRRSLTILLLLALWCAPLPLFAQAHQHGNHRYELTESLHLNTEQQNKLREIYARFQKPKDDLRSQIKEHRLAITNEMSAATPDRNVIEQHLQEVIRLEGERQRVMVDEYFEILSVLTPSQKKTFQEQMVKHITEER